MRAALVVVDMLVDHLQSGAHGAIERQGMALVPVLQDLLASCRKGGVPIVYANDSFLPGDALFGGRMGPHALRGTSGECVIPEIAPKPGDLVLPKRRFSAFYKTDLDQTLRTWGTDTVAVCGITTHVCVLTTALDAVANDFRAAILEDACAAYKPEVHEACLALYRENALWPLLRVESSRAFLAEMERGADAGGGRGILRFSGTGETFSDSTTT